MRHNYTILRRNMRFRHATPHPARPSKRRLIVVGSGTLVLPPPPGGGVAFALYISVYSAESKPGANVTLGSTVALPVPKRL
jgi:hypothetical protein